MVSQSGTNTSTTGSTTSFTITNSFIWRDRALQSSISNAQSGGTTTSTFVYNANNYLTQVSTTGASAKVISYTTDAVGQIMVRTQTTNGSSNSPKDFSFYFNGIKIGQIGNNGTDNVDYAAAIKDNGTADGTGAFREGKTSGTMFSDFDQNWTAIDPAAGLEGANGSYTVQAGQTLSSIAQALWGDASLWYMLAQANGLTSDEGVTAGQVLSVPAQVTNFHNAASTYKPYDAGKAMGDVAPGSPRPPKPNKCGVFGAVLMAAVAIAVAAVVGPAIIGAGNLVTSATVVGGVQLSAGGAAILGTATGLTGAIGSVGAAIVGGAVAAAAGSTASQLFGMATGIQQNGFNWKSVAMAAVTGGVSGGLAKVDFLNGAKGPLKIGQTIARGTAANVATQSIASLSRLQREIDWTGVAVAAVVSGTSSLTGGRGIAGSTMNGLAASIAAAGARHLLDGTDFGDTLIASLPDVFGQTVVSTIGELTTRAHGPKVSKRDKLEEIRLSGGGVVYRSPIRFAQNEYAVDPNPNQQSQVSDGSEWLNTEITVTGTKYDNWLEEATGIDIDWSGSIDQRNLKISLTTRHNGGITYQQNTNGYVVQGQFKGGPVSVDIYRTSQTKGGKTTTATAVDARAGSFRLQGVHATSTDGQATGSVTKIKVKAPLVTGAFDQVSNNNGAVTQVVAKVDTPFGSMTGSLNSDIHVDKSGGLVVKADAAITTPFWSASTDLSASAGPNGAFLNAGAKIDLPGVSIDTRINAAASNAGANLDLGMNGTVLGQKGGANINLSASDQGAFAQLGVQSGSARASVLLSANDSGASISAQGGVGRHHGGAAIGVNDSGGYFTTAQPRVELRNGYRYSFDQTATRVSTINGTLVYNPAQVRNPLAQLNAGGNDRLIDDHGGHYIARVFNGPTDDFNHFAQNGNFNLGEYRKLENGWSREVQAGKIVTVDIRSSYPGASLRPEFLDVRFTVDGQAYRVPFTNRPGGR